MRASPQEFDAHTFTTRSRPSSSALRNSWPALRCRLTHIEPFHSACPASSHHPKPPFPGAGNFAHSQQVALSASKRASKHQQQTLVESASSKHVEVMLLTSDNLRWWLHSLTHVDKSRYKWKCFCTPCRNSLIVCGTFSPLSNLSLFFSYVAAPAIAAVTGTWVRRNTADMLLSQRERLTFANLCQKRHLLQKVKPWNIQCPFSTAAALSVLLVST